MRAWARSSFVLLTLAGAAAIAWSSLGYSDDETVPEFIVEKLPQLRFEALWLLSLKVHVVTACLTLPACVLLLTDLLQRRVQVHRWVGRVTGLLVLLLLVPSGGVLAFDAKGGPWVSGGFLLSAALIAGLLVRGVRAARRHDVAGHRAAMWHVVAQMSVAVTSRAMLLGFEAAGLDPDVAYVAALWVPVVGSALVVEVLSRVRRSERNRREDLAPVAGARVLAPALARARR